MKRGVRFVVLVFAVWIAACPTSVKSENSGSASVSGRIAVPPLTGRVIDLDSVLATEDRERLSNQLGSYEQETGHQVAVLIIPTLGEEAIESFCLRTAKAWRLGRKGIDDGVVVCMAMKEKSARIELGFGINRYISNADAQEIMDREMTPAFAKRDFAGGLERGLKKLMEEGRRFVAMDARIVEHFRDIPRAGRSAYAI